MDPVRNPYAPGAGQRPPELTGRDREIGQFEVVLERVARGRPERSMVLTGLRGVGKTVLLNTFRSMALQRLWGTGKIEARPDQSIRRPVAAALHMAVRELAPRHRAPDRVEYFLGVLKAFAARDPKAPKGSSVTSALGIDVPMQRGRADSGDLEVDLTELFAEAASVAGDLGVGIALFVDEMQDIPAADVSALCAACHELSQTGGPLIVVGAGLPHLPAVLSASKSYSERLFRYARIDRLDREAADLALIAPAQREDVTFTAEALDALYAAADGYPYFVQAYGKVTWDVAAASPVTAADVSMAAPEAEGELAVGFFGSRYERATLVRAAVHAGDGRDRGRPGADVGGGRRTRAQAVQPVTGPGRADQEGADLQLRARPDRVHRPALRQVPALPARLGRNGQVRLRWSSSVGVTQSNRRTIH